MFLYSSLTTRRLMDVFCLCRHSCWLAPGWVQPIEGNNRRPEGKRAEKGHSYLFFFPSPLLSAASLIAVSFCNFTTHTHTQVPFSRISAHLTLPTPLSPLTPSAQKVWTFPHCCQFLSASSFLFVPITPSVSSAFNKFSSMNHQKWFLFPAGIITDTVDGWCLVLFCVCLGKRVMLKMSRIFTYS